MSQNFFSNNDPDLPKLNLKHLPRIKSGLPQIKMQGESDFLFEFPEGNVSMDEVADQVSNLFFNS